MKKERLKHIIRETLKELNGKQLLNEYKPKCCPNYPSHVGGNGECCAEFLEYCCNADLPGKTGCCPGVNDKVASLSIGGTKNLGEQRGLSGAEISMRIHGYERKNPNDPFFEKHPCCKRHIYNQRCCLKHDPCCELRIDGCPCGSGPVKP